MYRRLFLFSAVPAVLLLAAPLAAHAAVPFFGPIIPADSATCPGGFALVMTVVNNIISFLLTIAIVFVAPLMIAYAGFLFVVNPVNEAGKTQAKHILWNTIIGIVIALASWTIVDAVMVVLYNPNAQNGQTRLGVWSSLVSGGGDVCIQLAGSLSQAQPPPPTTTGVTPGAPTGAFSIPAAVRYADGNAQLSSTGQCALYVREALSAGGLSSFDTNHPTNAYQYGSYLTAAGFQTVSASGYAPLAGDVVVFQPVSGHPSGHIAIYDGSQWVSDFKQNSMYPAAAYQGGSYTVYRWPQSTAGPKGEPVQCPVASGPTIKAAFAGAGNHVHVPSDSPFASLPSGTVLYLPLPAAYGQVDMTYTGASPPDPATYEISINQCPGVITQDDPSCYFTGTNPFEQTLTWGNVTGEPTCRNATNDGTWYANIRYTYSGSCPLYGGTCGQSLQWNPRIGTPLPTGAGQCPALPSGATKGTLPDFQGLPQYPMPASGQILYYPLTAIPSNHSSAQIHFGETPRAYSPSPYSMDASISTCPGVISPPSSGSDVCNFQGVSQTNGATFGWANTQSAANANLFCYAPESKQYYFNVRWTYASCAQGAAQCGFSLSTTDGGPPATNNSSTNQCPAPHGTDLGMNYYSSTKSVLMSSGDIAYTKVVPIPAQNTGKYSNRFEWIQGTNTPGSIASEVSISKCPGVIDTSVPGQCYESLPPGANYLNAISIYEKPKDGPNGWSDQATLGSKGCWVPEADASSYYVNLRYTYGSCPISGGCGFNVAWIAGEY